MVCCAKPVFVCLGLRSGSVAVGSCLKALWKGSARGCAPCCRLPALCSTAMHILWVCCRHPLCHTLTEADLHLFGSVPPGRRGSRPALDSALPAGLFPLLPPMPYNLCCRRGGPPWGSQPALGFARHCWAVYSFSDYVFNLCRRGGSGVQGYKADEAQRNRHRWGAGPLFSLLLPCSRLGWQALAAAH